MTIFGQFTSGFNSPPTIDDMVTLILASLTLLGLSIFGPGIANGLIAGGPQLGAGAAVGTGLAAAGTGRLGLLPRQAGSGSREVLSPVLLARAQPLPAVRLPHSAPVEWQVSQRPDSLLR